MIVEVIAGPVLASVISCYDGDTCKMMAMPWPDVFFGTSVRIDGVDTPEIKGKCQAEKDLAIKARDFVRERIAGREVHLTDIHQGKYAGRVVATVWVDGEKLSDLLIFNGLGREYHGGAREDWC